MDLDLDLDLRIVDLHLHLDLAVAGLVTSLLNILNNIHEDFYGLGHSAVELTNDILLGRPYGGTCILYRKFLAQNVKTILESYDSRITAISFNQ